MPTAANSAVDATTRSSELVASSIAQWNDSRW